MSASPPRIPRTESVGSLIRPGEITQMIRDVYAGETMAHPSIVLHRKSAEMARLTKACDEATRELVRKQLEVGLEVVNDGEVRRAVFVNSLNDALEGLEPMGEIPSWPTPDGDVEYFGDPIFAGKLRKRANPLVEEATVMRTIAPPVPFKLTIPTPTMFLWGPVAAPEPYASQLEMLDDIAGIVNEMALEAVAAGATWLQFDAPFYPAYDPESGGDGATSAQETAQTLGITGDELLTKAVELENKVIADLPAHVVTATHICRGNMLGAGRKLFKDDSAERIFSEVPYQRWLIEWEDPARHGDFSALRFVPKDKVVVLGLVSTKTPEIESEDEIVRKIEEASQYISVDQLALSPQCGFSSSAGFQLVKTEELQWRKLELVRHVADRVWGR